MSYKIFLKNKYVYETEKVEIKGHLVCFVDKYNREHMINQDQISNIRQGDD
jgi:hypothetical protein